MPKISQLPSTTVTGDGLLITVVGGVTSRALAADVAADPQIITGHVEASMGQFTGNTGSSTATTSEIFNAVSGVITPTATDKASIDVASTAGAWTLNLSDMPQDRPASIYVKIDSSGAHTPTFPTTVVWDGGSAPSGTLWANGKRAVIRFTRVPFTNLIEGKLVASGDSPVVDDIPAVTPVTATFTYSTSSSRSSPVTLAAATLPAGSVAVNIGPFASTIVHVDVWHNHSGGLPAVGSEATVDSYIGRRSVFPYDFLGGTTTTAVMWDTRYDPTGNNRTGYNPAGSNTITVRFVYTDATTSTATVTFNTGNPTAALGDYSATYGSSTQVTATPSTTVTVPDAVNRAFAAVFVYRGDRQYTGATLGGVALSVAGSYYNTTEGHGLLAVVGADRTAEIPAAGARALVPTFSGSMGAITVTHVHYWTMVNTGTETYFGASSVPYSNAGSAISLALSSVPVSASVFTVAGCDGAASTFTNTYDGTLETRLSTDSSYDVSSQAEWKSNNGDAGDVTIGWTPTGTKMRGIALYAMVGVGTTTEAVTPGTPSLTTPTKPADNQLRTTWAATANAVSYEGRIGTTNPPTTSAIALGNVTDWTRSGLSPSTLYYMQVRAVSSTNTRSAWSTAVSGTTNASTVVVGGISQSRFIHGNFADLNAITHTYGGTHRTDGVLVPNWHGHYNLGPGWGEVVDATRVGSPTETWRVYNKAQNQWNQNSTARPAAMTEIGQRTYLMMKLSNAGSHYAGTQPSNAELAVLDLARSGSTGTDNRNTLLREMGTNLQTWPGKVILMLSWESNGYWYSNFSGVNTALIGSTALASVPNSQFGSAMGAAVRQVSVDGNIGHVHKLAFEHAAQEVWSTGPGVILSYGLSASGSSVPPGTTPTGSLQSQWIWQDIAHPRPEFFDVFGISDYCRDAGRPIYKGTGSVDLTSSYTFQNPGVNSLYNQKSIEWNRPLGFVEYGCNWDVFDWEPTFTGGPTDNQSNAFWKLAAEAMPLMDLGFLTYWHSGADRKAGSTYQLPEANYGYQKTSGTTRAFPKTTATLQSIF